MQAALFRRVRYTEGQLAALMAEVEELRSGRQQRQHPQQHLELAQQLQRQEGSLADGQALEREMGW